MQLLDICWAFLWIEDAESSQETKGIFETTADLPADLFQVRLQHIVVDIFSCCLQIYNTNCKVCDCVMDCENVLLIIGTFLDLLQGVLDICQLAGYKSDVCCLGLQGSAKTSQYRKDITWHHQGRHKVVCLHSPQHTKCFWLSSILVDVLKFIYQWPHEHLIAFTDLLCASQWVSHWHHEHCLCIGGHMFFSFAVFQLLDVCQV